VQKERKKNQMIASLEEWEWGGRKAGMFVFLLSAFLFLSAATNLESGCLTDPTPNRNVQKTGMLDTP